jgi:hypothetical protein
LKTRTPLDMSKPFYRRNRLILEPNRPLAQVIPAQAAIKIIAFVFQAKARP